MRVGYYRAQLVLAWEIFFFEAQNFKCDQIDFRYGSGTGIEDSAETLVSWMCPSLDTKNKNSNTASSEKASY